MIEAMGGAQEEEEESEATLRPSIIAKPEG